jgi:ribosomal protein S18 acetylase RimI-like enzyme
MKDTRVQVGQFELRHIAAARSLWEQSEGVGLSAADEAPNLAAFLSRNPGLSYVAERDGELLGTVLCGHDGRRGLIHHLVVSMRARRNGLGRELLQRGLMALSGAGIEKAHLLVFRNNAPGLAFWRAVGAEERYAIALFSILTGGLSDRADR